MAALTAGCVAPGEAVRVRGMLDLDRDTLTACESRSVFDLLLADTARHHVTLRVKAISPRGGRPVLAEFEGELHDTPSMARHPERRALRVSRILAVEAGSCG